VCLEVVIGCLGGYGMLRQLDRARECMVVQSMDWLVGGYTVFRGGYGVFRSGYRVFRGVYRVLRGGY